MKFVFSFVSNFIDSAEPRMFSKITKTCPIHCYGTQSHCEWYGFKVELKRRSRVVWKRRKCANTLFSGFTGCSINIYTTIIRNMTSWGYQYWHKRNRNLFPWGSSHVVYSALYRPRAEKRFLVMFLVTFSNIPALFVTSLISRRLLATNKQRNKEKNSPCFGKFRTSIFNKKAWNGME